MREIDVATLPVVGALDQVRTPLGAILYRRSPAWARDQIVDPFMDLVVQMPAGVRLEFTTASAALELDAMLTTVEVEGLAPPSVMFDVVWDGEVRSSVPATGGTRILAARDGSLELVPGVATTVRLELPGDDKVPVQVWLPHNAAVQVFAARIDGDVRLQPLTGRRRRWVHHGSSISHCLEAPSPTQTWPALVALAADIDLLNLGFAGQCVLDPHVARTIRDLDADLITLKVGINIVGGDLMRERVFVPALHGFLDTVRDGHPRTPVVVVTAIHAPAVEVVPGPFTPGPDGGYAAVVRSPELAEGAMTLRRTRELVAQVVETRRRAGDADLHLLDGLELFGPEDAADLPDDLHPSPAGYRRIAERFHRMVFGDGSIVQGRPAEARA